MTEFRPTENNARRNPVSRWTWRVLTAALLISLLVGGIAGGIVGGTATYLVMNWAETEPAAANPAAEEISTTPAGPTRTPAPLPPASEEQRENLETIPAIVERISPAVVTVINRMSNPASPWGDPDDLAQARGSGVIVTTDGYIVTNFHVVENAQSLTVLFPDGRQTTAQLVGHDYPFSDLAVIKVQGSEYPYAPLGDSDALRVGETVIAIGSALGDFQNTVTSGVISGLGRSLDISANRSLEGMIQTDAAINHGNSGGPLVNLSGEVVGINTAIIRGDQYSGDVAEGLGFSIPSNIARFVVEELIENGQVSRPYLGVRTVAVTPQMAAYYGLPVSYGVYVQEVLANTPADRAGIRDGDIIIRIGEDTIDEDNPLINVLSHYRSGQQVEVEVNRDGESLILDLELGERPPDL